MPRFLVFRLYGPMASWADVAVGEHRPTFAHPTRSAVLGLLGAALGIRREDAEGLAALDGSVRFAVRVDRPGTHLSDFHTAQVAPARGNRGRRYRSRRDELAGPSDTLTTILSRRDYRLDALVTVVLEETPTALVPLERLADGIRQPTFTLSLGRKSCPPALPLHPQLVEAESAVAAIAATRFPELGVGADPKRSGDIAEADFFFEPGLTAGTPALHAVPRRDQALSRTRWQFGVRVEHFARVSLARPEEIP